MGKRAGSTAASPATQPSAKARMSPVSQLLGVTYGPTREVPPEAQLPAYHLWRMQVLEESRSYYAQRSDTWMRILYERCLGCARHPLALEFLDAPTQKQLRKLPWRINPKETCDKFDAFVKSKCGDIVEPAAEGQPDAVVPTEGGC